MVERVRALLTLRQLSPTQFADLIQVGRPIVSHILSGRNKVSLEVVQRIVAAFPEVALPWLLSGTGPMLTSTAPASALEPSTANEATTTGPTALSLDVTIPKKGRKSARLASAPVPLASSPERPSLSDRQAPRKFRVSRRPQGGGESDDTSPLATLFGAATTRSPSTGSPHAEESVASGKADTATIASTISAQAAAQQPELRAVSDADAGISGAPSAGQSARLAADKSIRRIVIFYQDGSFSDFRPES